MPVQRDNLGRFAVRLAKWTACAGVFALVARHVVANWSLVMVVDTPQWRWIGAAFAAGAMAWFANVRVFQSLVRSHGFTTSFARAAGLYSVPMLGRYVPGKVWSVLGSIWFFGREGISKSVAVTSLALNTVLGLTSGVFVSLAAIAGEEMPPVGRFLMVSVALLLLILIHPRVFNRCINWGLRRLGRDEIVSSLSFGSVLRLTAVKVAAWGWFGIGFYCVVRSIAFAPIGMLPQVIGLFASAQIAGFAVLFAPAGVGVREGVLIAGLSPLVGPGPAIVISGVCRIWQTILELAMAFFGWWSLRRSGAVPANAKHALDVKTTTKAADLGSEFQQNTSHAEVMILNGEQVDWRARAIAKGSCVVAEGKQSSNADDRTRD